MLGAYQWLKDTKQFDAIKNDWQTVHKTAPFAVQKELIELEQRGVTLTDVNLFWNSIYLQKTYIEGEIVTFPRFENTEWLEHMYSIWQEVDPALHSICYTLVSSIHVPIQLTYAQKKALVEEIAYNSQYGQSPYFYVFKSLTGITVPSRIGLDVIFRYCDIELIRRIDSVNQLNRINDMLNDVDEPKEKFMSINDIERAHEERIDRITVELIKDCAGDRFEYHPVFRDLVHKHKLLLPTGPDTLIKRGKQHYNCVGTYVDKQLSGTTRIVLTADTTCEIYYEVSTDIIVATQVKQCKGVRNVDKDRRPFDQFRIEIVGQSSKILEVKRVKGTNVIRESGY